METATAFAEGKRVQFKKYQDYFNVEGWKRNIDQGDGSVRNEHAENTAEGWIPANQLFKATQTQREPHSFGCRCTTDDRLTKPE
jgi:hypothetical protein